MTPTPLVAKNATTRISEQSAVVTVLQMTEPQRSNAMQCFRSVREGVDVPLSHEEMLELQTLGLVSDLTEPTGRGRNARRYEFFHTNKMEDVYQILFLENQLKQLRYDHTALLNEYFASKKAEAERTRIISEKIASLHSMVEILHKRFVGDEQLSGSDRNMPGKPNQNNLADEPRCPHGTLLGHCADCPEIPKEAK